MENMLNKDNWKEEHLSKKHLENHDWCLLCVARKNGENVKGGDLSIQVNESIKLKSGLK